VHDGQARRTQWARARTRRHELLLGGRFPAVYECHRLIGAGPPAQQVRYSAPGCSRLSGDPASSIATKDRDRLETTSTIIARRPSTGTPACRLDYVRLLS